jgi:hypothetical protein
MAASEQIGAQGEIPEVCSLAASYLDNSRILKWQN